MEIYTHDEATIIVGMLEEILTRYDICVPSPEDDDREPEDMVGLYGSTYSELLDGVEDQLRSLLERYKPGDEVIANKYSGTV